MFLRLFLMMTLIPILEIVFILHVHGELASWLGSGEALFITIGSVIFTGIVGANLAKSQGFQTLSKIQSSMARGEIPASEMVDGVMILVGGVLLLTPGYATDLLGFLLLFPLSRAAFKSGVSKWITEQVKTGSVRVSYYGTQGGGGFQAGGSFQRNYQSQDPNILDVEPISDRSDNK